LGVNYKKHGDETGMSYPDQPVLFLKATSLLPAMKTRLFYPPPDRIAWIMKRNWPWSSAEKQKEH